MEADIGLIGLAVMGQNLVLNMNDHGFKVVVFNRTVSKVDDFLKGPAKNTQIQGALTLEEFFKRLKKPRKVMLMVKAGAPVDDLIEECMPFLETGDVVIDGGNSFYLDTERRVKELEKKGILFVGTGISGGEEGARHGPSIMPGGSSGAWPLVKPIFQAIAAKADDGAPCCDWIGEGGAGHYVKMVHNGIEYGDMQLTSEAYHLLKDVIKASASEMQKIFTEWNQGELSSYLVEITAQILGFLDKDGQLLLDKIVDKAGQKGTGKWTGISALELGVPVTLIGEAVFARCLSSMKEERVKASQHYSAPSFSFSGDKKTFTNALKEALYMAKIISYAQGFMLMRTAAFEMHWKLNYGSIALMWREGCIIRSVFLNKIKGAYDQNKDLANLLLAPFFIEEIKKCERGLRQTMATACQAGIPTPTLGTALSFFDGYRSARLPANLLQAQRDFFGAHTYERVDSPGKFVHTNWTGTGGSVSSSTYNV
jgi:6-phosphogluconate dehydrogenase